MGTVDMEIPQWPVYKHLRLTRQLTKASNTKDRDQSANRQKEHKGSKDKAEDRKQHLKDSNHSPKIRESATINKKKCYKKGTNKKL